MTIAHSQLQLGKFKDKVVLSTAGAAGIVAALTVPITGVASADTYSGYNGYGSYNNSYNGNNDSSNCGCNGYSGENGNSYNGNDNYGMQADSYGGQHMYSYGMYRWVYSGQYQRWMWIGYNNNYGRWEFCNNGQPYWY